MTDKIDPGWVNDRLPKEDGDASELNYVLYLHSDKTVHCCSYTDINYEDSWCRVPDAWNDGWPKDWRNLIALPQECLDREKGDEFPEEYRDAIGGNDEVLSLKASNEVHFRELKIYEDKCKDLTQALAKEKREHAESLRRYELLREECDNSKEAIRQYEESGKAMLKDLDEANEKINKFEEIVSTWADVTECRKAEIKELGEELKNSKDTENISCKLFEEKCKQNEILWKLLDTMKGEK